MLRLASRVAAAHLNNLYVFPAEQPGSKLFELFVEEFKADLSQALVLVADNVAAHYCDQTKQQWSAKTDFPCQIPFHSTMFIEWVCPPQMRNSHGGLDKQSRLHCGVLLRLRKSAEGRWKSPSKIALPANVSSHRDIPDGSEWVVDVRYAVYDPDMDALVMPILLHEYFLDKDGTYLESGGTLYPQNMSAEEEEEMYHSYLFMLRDVYMLALSFANCKNITQSEAKERAPPAKWSRRMKAPEFRYHVLSINSGGKKRTTMGPTAGDGPGKALHIVRGNFATYTEDKPLFGKVVGRVWRPSHASGSDKFGVVDKDYNIRKAEGPDEK